MLAEKIGAETIELSETTGRRGIFGFIKSGFQAVKKKSSELSGKPWDRAREFDTLYLMTPIWAGNGTPAMNAFLENADLNGKTVFTVTLQADPNTKGNEKVHEYLRGRIEEKGGTVEGSFALHSASRPGAFAGEEHIKNEVEKIST